MSRNERRRLEKLSLSQWQMEIRGEVKEHGVVEWFGEPRPRLRTAYDWERDFATAYKDRVFLKVNRIWGSGL